jgi:thiol-disulfide isomerase/thioredoxin
VYLRKWQKVQDSLFASVMPNGIDGQASSRKGNLPKVSIANNDRSPANGLNSDEALTSYNYPKLIFWFCLREKERLWMEEHDHPTSFYKQWYHTTPAKGKAFFRDERGSLLVEKIINKYFTGKTAEYAYSGLLKYNLYSSNYQNITLIFDHLKQKYPNSKYIAEFTAPINEIAQKQSMQLNDKMVFVANNGTKLNTLKEVAALTKGKTVLVDMWGTWCSPCREEIEKNAVALETYFKGTNVGFLYIDSHDVNNESGWKKLIAYYHMEGMHILANEKLDKDIMKKTGGQGYPTYFIIKKDGSYGLTKTRYPIDRQAMINELLAASK